MKSLLYAWVTSLMIFNTIINKTGVATAKSVNMIGGLPAGLLEKLISATNSFDGRIPDSLIDKSLETLSEFYWKTFWLRTNFPKSTPSFSNAIKAHICHACSKYRIKNESKQSFLVDTKTLPYNGGIFGK